MTNLSQIPKEMHWVETKNEFSVVWKDGHQTLFEIPFLRQKCPCALCRAERESNNPFKVVKELTPKAYLPLTLEPVGHYAIKIEWADGHSTGIYTFEWLRKYCHCSECKKNAE